MELDEVYELVETKIDVRPAATGTLQQLFQDNGEIKWLTFKANPHRAFVEAFQRSSFSSFSRHTNNKTKLISENKEDPSWKFDCKVDKSLSYFPEIKYDRKETFAYACSCTSRFSLCQHVKAGFDLLELKYGRDYFVQFRDWTDEKTKLLEEYGLKPGDKEVEDFIFSFDFYGNLVMQAPPFFWTKNAGDNVQRFKKLLAPAIGEHTFIDRPKLGKEIIIDFQTGFLFNLLSQHFKLGFELETIKVFDKPNGKQFKKLSVHQPANLSLLKELPDDVYALLLSISDEGVKKHLAQNGHGYVTQYSSTWQNMSDATLAFLQKYYIGQLQKLWPYLCSYPEVHLLTEGTFSNKNIRPAKLSPDLVSFSFTIKEDERFITIQQQVVANEKVLFSTDAKLFHSFLFMIEGVLYMPANLEDLAIVKQFQFGYIKIPVEGKL